MRGSCYFSKPKKTRISATDAATPSGARKAPDPLIDIGIRQRKKLLERRQPRLVHARNALIRITPQDEVQFFGAAMIGAIKRALASDFKPVHEKPCGSREAAPVVSPSFAQYRRMSNSFQFDEAPLSWNSAAKRSSPERMTLPKPDAPFRIESSAVLAEEGLYAPLQSLKGLGARGEELL